MSIATPSSISLSALRELVGARPAHVAGNVLLPELVAGVQSSLGEAPVGIAFGVLDDTACTVWLSALAPDALVLHVAARPAEGVKALFARFTERATDQMPVDDVCTVLFRGGVRALQVRTLEGRRDLLVVLGRKA